MPLTLDRTTTRGLAHRGHAPRYRAPVRRIDRAGEIRSLDSRVDGRVVLRGDPGWDAARAAWSVSIDERPAAIVPVRSMEDVVEVVEFARAHGLRIAPRGGEMWAIALLEDTTERKGDCR
jgi:hypothetical protein